MTIEELVARLMTFDLKTTVMCRNEDGDMCDINWMGLERIIGNEPEILLIDGE